MLTVTGFTKPLEFELKALNADCEGCYILLEAVVQGSNYTFVNIYAPNKYVNLEPFDSENHTQLCLNGQNVALSKVVSKAVYKELRSRVIKQPTAQSKYEAEYANVVLDWKKIYSLPFTVAMDSKTRQF